MEENTMDNKKLNDSELEQVSGGQDVMPVIFASTKEVDEQMMKVGYIKAVCPNPSCQFEMHLPPLQAGKQVTCQECGNVFTVKG